MIDWAHLFGFSVNPVEIFVRGTVIYWFIFLLFRFMLRRDIGAIAIADVMLLVLIADAASNGMSGGYDSITDGCILVATLAGWNYFLDWMSFHFPAVRRLVQAVVPTDIRPARVPARATAWPAAAAAGSCKKWQDAAESHEAGIDYDGRIAIEAARARYRKS